MNYYFDFPESPFEIQKLLQELKNILPLRQDLLAAAENRLKEINKRPHTKSERLEALEHYENCRNECVSVHLRISACDKQLSKIGGKYKH